MRTIQEQYNKHINGEISKEKFLYNLRRDPNLSQFITNLTSYNDAIRILKNRSIISEAKKSIETLTLDTVNPYEYKKGLEIELDLCYKATPKFIAPEIFQKVQSKILKNLAKDPNYYTKMIAGQDAKGDLASDADFGKKSKRSDVNIPIKNGFKDEKNALKSINKNLKSNVSDTLGNKEKAKKKKLNESKLTGDMSPFQKGRPTILNQNVALEENNESLEKGVDDSGLNMDFDQLTQYENLPATNTDVIPFANVQPGQKVVDDSGEQFKVLAKGNYNDLKRYDSSKVFDRFLSSDPKGIDATQLVALIDKDGNTFVRVYGTGGVYAYGNNPSVKEYNNNDDLKNKKKAYIQAKIKSDQDELNSLRENKNMKEFKLTNILKKLQLNEASPEFEAEVGDKEIPQDETEMAEAKAAVLPTITKAGLHKNFDLDSDIALKNGYIWVKVRLGYGILSKEQLKALTSDGKFEGVNPVTDTEVTLIFSKA